MENIDHILLFKTNIEACHQEWLKDIFDREPDIYEWSIDLEDEDRVLRLKSALEYKVVSDQQFSENTAALKLESNVLLENFVQSLAPYLDRSETEYQDFLSLKNKEIILILLKTNPDLLSILFDFNDPGKIDLEDFMNNNFHFNVSLERFAYLSGRSLTSFKQDFNKIFKISPGRWLLNKRLQEAHHLIKNKKRKPTDVYLEVGFEDLSHFSFAFKKLFGCSPSRLISI